MGKLRDFLLSFGELKYKKEDEEELRELLISLKLPPNGFKEILLYLLNVSSWSFFFYCEIVVPLIMIIKKIFGW